MLDAIEHFSDVYQHTIAAIGAISTLAAVIVSLVLAFITKRSHRTRITVRAAVTRIFHSSLEGKPKPEYFSVDITNIGLMPATIPFSFFNWKVPFKRGYWMVNPWDYLQHDPWVPQKQYPVEIKPRGSATIFLNDSASFRASMAEMLRDVRRMRWRASFMYAVARTNDGQVFRVKLDKSVRREIAKVRRSVKSLDHV